jgi:predicted ATP-grasp superfamily ATP-dependent carboligase
MTLDTRATDEHGPWTTARIAPGLASRALPEMIRRADLTIPIAPETGGTLRDLADLIAEAGGHSLGSMPGAIDIAADKLRLAAHLSAAGVRCPCSTRFVPRDGLSREASYPAILKPIDGAGCVETLFVTGPNDPLVSTFSGDVGLLQPFVPGEPRSATFLAHPGGPPILLCVARQFIEIAGGRLAYRGGRILTEDLPRDHPARLAVSSVPGLSGLIGVDYIQDHATSAVVLEINPRPTTSCVGLIAALGPGRLATAWLDSAHGRSIALDLPARSLSFRPDGSTFEADRPDVGDSFHRCA